MSRCIYTYICMYYNVYKINVCACMYVSMCMYVYIYIMYVYIYICVCMCSLYVYMCRVELSRYDVVVYIKFGDYAQSSL